MKPLRIDFAPTTFWRAVAQTKLATWLLWGIGFSTCLSMAFAVHDLTEKNNALQIELERIDAQLAAKIARKPVVKKTIIAEVQIDAMNRAILQLNLPWRDLLDAIEAATPATVALLALEPDAKKNTLKGMAETKSSNDMIAYIEELKKQEFFNDVVLTKHEVNGQGPNRPIRFQFEAQWTEPGK